MSHPADFGDGVDFGTVPFWARLLLWPVFLVGLSAIAVAKACVAAGESLKRGRR